MQCAPLTFFQLWFILCAVHRRVEQLAARRAHNPEVVGSSPTPAKFEKASLFKDAFFFQRKPERIRKINQIPQSKGAHNIFILRACIKGSDAFYPKAID